MRQTTSKQSLTKTKTPIAVVVFLILVILPIRFSAGPLQMTGLRTYLILMVVPCIWRIMRHKSAAWPVDCLLGLTAIWIAVSIFHTASFAGLERAGSVILDFLGGYLIARAFITNRDTFSATIKTTVALIVVTLPFAMIETFTGAALILTILQAIPGITGPDIVDMPLRYGLDRAQTVFTHPIHYGLFCSTMTALFLIGGRKTSGLSVQVLGGVILCLACVMSLSSGAILSLLLQIFLIAWAVILGRVPYRWAFLIGFMVVAYIAVDLISSRSPYRVFLSYATFSAHNAYWRGLIFDWGVYNLLANPVFGVGNSDWVRPSFMKTNTMDNFWLYTGVKYGFPALICLSLACITALVSIARQIITDPQDRDIRLAWMICFAGLSFTLATVHVWTAIYSYVFFLLGAGLWLLPPQEKRRPRRSDQLSRTFDIEFSRKVKHSAV